MNKFFLFGGIVCALDAIALLLIFDNVGGFMLGFFGFALCLTLAPLVSRLD